MSPSQLPSVRRGAPPADRGATAPTRQRQPPADRGATAPTRQREPPPGARTRARPEGPLVLERYRLAHRLGSGAFGTVWAARDERLGRDVAVKIIPRERVVGGRFEREARTTARLSHPAIVTLYEAAVDDDGAYLVSELVRGRTLQAALESGHLSDRGIVRLGIALCDALAHAHAHGVIHRDVKPSNVLLPARPASGAYPVKLTDFGVARVLGGDSLTRTGDIVGTAAYMAPEQAEGRSVGPEADLYALALVVYEALTGVNPVRNGVLAHRARRLSVHLPPVRRQRRELPRQLGAGIDLALRPRPSERGTIGELRAALVASLELVADHPGTVGAPWRAPWSRPPVGATPLEDGALLRDAEAGRGAQAGRGAEAELDPGAWPPAVVFAEPAGSFRQSGPEPRAGTLRTIPRPARALAALATAGAAAWIAAQELSPGKVSAGLIALPAALAVTIWPRLGWIAFAGAVTLLSVASGHAGAALVLLALLVLPAALLPADPAAWPLPGGAVALGLIGVAGGWPAAAARLGDSVWRRAVLAACGMFWLAGAGQLAGADLLLRRSPAALPPSLWTTSPGMALRHVQGAIVAPGVLAAALVWAAGAAILPPLSALPGRRARWVAVAAWAVACAVATGAAVGLGGPDRPPTLGLAVIGTIAAAAIALVPERARRPRSPGVAAQLS